MIIKNLICCALITLIAFSTPALADHNIVGDVNNDGRITAADSLLALQMSVGSIAPDLEIADVNADGKVNSPDALMMLMMAQKAQVCVDAPGVVSGTFNTRINMYNVADIDSGQFDLSFDASVVNVTGVDPGSIDGTEVPVDMWELIDSDTIRVVFNLPDTDGVSGSGTLATISFEVLGVIDDTSVLDISDGLLVDIKSNEISSLWFDNGITVGIPATVNAPEPVSGTFDATIDIADIINLDSGQFDLSFDASVVNVTGVDPGSIDGTEVPVDMWRFIDTDTIRVIFNLPDTAGVSGSGSLATINFEVLGAAEDTSVLAISDGLLVDTESDEISSLWSDSGITVGAPVTVNAPEVVSGTFDATIDIADITNLDSGEFDLSFDASVVNVTGVDPGSIDGTEVPIDMWRFIDTDTIRVIFNLPDTTGVSGSGSLVRINFEVLGVTDDTSVLAISDGLLVDIESNEMSSVWFDDEITLELPVDVIPVDVPVTVNAPEVVTGTFDATLDIADVTNLDYGEFDLSFDSSVVNVTGVNSGSIGGTEIPIDEWDFIDPDTIRVLFNLPGTTGVSGSGSLATISFEVLGVTGDTSLLAISDGLLVDTESNEISSLWYADEITVEVPVDVPVTVNAPEIVTDTFDATLDIADVINLDYGEFTLSFDSSVVNVTGVNSGSIGGTQIPIDEWDFIDTDTIRVLFNLPGTTGVSGSGSLATISLEVLGVTGDTSVLAISDGMLVDTGSNEISSLWYADEITVEVAVDVPVTVNAPEIVTDTFDATIDIADVINLDYGEFVLSFDASVVNVTGVNSGSIDGMEIPIDEWDFIDPDTIRVLFNLPGTTGVSGSGSLATISFEVLGMTDDTSILAISDGLLVDTGSNEISSLWYADEITVEVPVDVIVGVPVTVNAPEVVTGTFDATIDIADVTDLDSGQFDLSFDANVVEVIGVDSGIIGSTTVQLETWTLVDSDTVRVLFNLPGTTGISGSGSLATIHFTVTGTAGDTSVLDISDGLLVDIWAEEILATWIDDDVSV
jgi:hypothetical protein